MGGHVNLLFLTTYVPTAWGMESGLPRKGDFERHAYDMVKELIDPEKIVSPLRDIYGTEVDQGDHYQLDTIPFERRIAIQFGLIHRKVKEEIQAPNQSRKRRYRCSSRGGQCARRRELNPNSA